jgi:hypothetical protein
MTDKNRRYRFLQFGGIATLAGISRTMEKLTDICLGGSHFTFVSTSLSCFTYISTCLSCT